MKRILFILTFIVCCSYSHAQFVAIPDSNFRNWIKSNIDPAAIVGNMLDTTNSKVVSRKGIYFNGNLNLSGIQFFDSLNTLTLGYGSHQGLSSLPPQLKKIYLDHSTVSLLDSTNLSVEFVDFRFVTFTAGISSLPPAIRYYKSQYSDYPVTDFPDSLISLFISDNDLFDSVPPLPVTLKYIRFDKGHYTTLPVIPDSVNALYIYDNVTLVNLSSLPAGLDTLVLHRSNVTELNGLPDGMTYLSATTNKISYLDSLPSSLITLEVHYNLIDSIEAFPAGLKHIGVGFNRLHDLPAFPATMLSLNFSNNPMDSFPDIGNTIEGLGCINTFPCLPKLPNSLRNIAYDHCIPNKPTSLIDEDLSVCDAPYIYTEGPDSIACDDTISVVPGLSYLWSNGDTINYIAGVCRSVFEVEYIDSSGCYYNSTINLTDTALHHSVRGISYLCTPYGNCDLFLDVTVRGGTPPYTYQWFDFDGAMDDTSQMHNQDVFNLCCWDIQQQYYLECVITDAVGRVDVVQEAVEAYDPPEPGSIGYGVVNPLCPGINDGFYYIWDAVNIPGGDINVLQCNIDTSYTVYTEYWGPGCETDFVFDPEYMFDSVDSVTAFTVDTPLCGMCDGQINFRYDYFDEPYMSRNIWHYVMDTITWDDHQSSICLNTVYYVSSIIDYSSGMCNYSQQELPWDTIYITRTGCTAIYPGDANNDGIADNVDVLSIGLAFNDTGSVRVDTTITWDAKYVMDWSNSFVDGTNHKHADCNGNGTVSDDDTVAVLQNYNFTHSNRMSNSSIAGSNTTLSIDVNDTLTGALYQEVALHFENASGVADSIHGIAFSVSYDPWLIKPSTIYFESDSGLFDIGASNFLSLQKTDAFNGRIDFALSFKDQINRPAEGFLGKLKFKLFTEVWSIPVESVIEVNNVYAINAEETEVIINGSYDSLLVIQCLASGYFTDLFVVSGPYCSGGTQWNCTGSLFAGVYNGTPPYSYEWFGFPGYDNDTLSGLCSIEGNLFGVIVTDAQGCTTYDEEDRSNGPPCPPWIINYGIDSISCPGMEDGQICVWWPIGADCGWFLRWSNGANTECIDDLSAGIYTCTILQTNNSSCFPDTIEVLTFDLRNPDNSFPVAITQPGCGLCNGTFTVNSNSTNSLIDVLYNGNSLSGFTLDSVCADSSYYLEIYYEGYDEVCVTDTSINVLCIPAPCSLQVNALVTNSCNGLCNGDIQLSVTGNTGNVTYDWSLSTYDTLCSNIQLNAANLDSLSTGNYICIVTDSIGCSDTVSATLYSTSLSVSLYSVEECYGRCAGYASATVNGGIGTIHYQWGDITTGWGDCNFPTFYDQASASDLLEGLYYCIATDSIGCSDSAVVDVKTANMDGLANYVVASTCASDCNGQINVTHFVWGVSPSTILWSDGYTGFTKLDLCAGSYTYTVFWGETCSVNDSAVLTGVDSVYLNYVTGNPTCDSCNGSVILNITGGTSPYQIYFDQLSSINNNDTIDGICSQMHHVEIIDSFSCYYAFDLNVGCDSATVGIVDNDYSEIPIVIAPNPNNGSFIISGLNAGEDKTVEIRNAIGELVLTKEKVREAELMISTTLPSGLYFCRIVSAQKYFTVKFIIN